LKQLPHPLLCLVGTTCTVLLLATCKPAEKPSAKPSQEKNDSEWVKALLDENLSKRTFSFTTVAEACSGKRVLPLNDSTAHQRVITTLEKALSATLTELNLPTSPVRQLRRINEASRFFEDDLLTRISALPGFSCEVPPTRNGGNQRAGYPDLRITDHQSGQVFYLDPKLVEHGSADSTFRTFYFEPKQETLKITDDAVHLIVGIEHDGNAPLWTFTGWRIVDLSSLRVRLKAEFQASNAGIYQNSKLSLPKSTQ